MRTNITFTLTWTRLAIALLVLLFLFVGGALAVAWSGAYSIAASRGHQPFVRAFLELGMRRSVAVNARAPARPNVEAERLVTIGATHYRTACATCHGAPGQPVDPIARAMLPQPPLLAPLIGEWDDDELHWIVTHGLQYTGMPGWPGADRPDEVWAVVAFLRALPGMSAAEYRALSMPPAPQSAREPLGELFSHCAACHGGQDSASNSPLTPTLSGQSAAYLERALREYRDGVRESGFMEPVASALEDADIDTLAALYSRIPPVARAGETNMLSERGLELATAGLPTRNVAACQSCHSGAARADYPALAGQPQAYLQAQLELWRRGGRAETAHGRTMAEIARQLTEEEIASVTKYYASLPPAIAAPPLQVGAAQ